jgi:hypothetical protein
MLSKRMRKGVDKQIDEESNREDVYLLKIMALIQKPLYLVS